MPRLIAAMILFVLAATLPAQEKFHVKLRKTKGVGDAGRIEDSESTTQRTIVKDADGKVLQDSTKKPGRSTTYVETILALDGTKPAKLTRKYEKLKIAEDGLEDEVPIAGKTVVIERKSPGKFEFKLEEGELPDRARKVLEDAFRNKEDEDKFNELVFGTEAIAVGATREFEAADAVKRLFKDAAGITLDQANAKGSVTLKEAYKKDGATFGKLVIELGAPITEVGNPQRKFKTEAGSKFKLTINMDACIDGSRTEGTSESELNLSVTAKIPADKMEVTLTQTVTSKLSEKRAMVKQ